MELEVFLVSVIYWMSILAVGIWLGRRLSSLKSRLADLEARGSDSED